MTASRGVRYPKGLEWDVYTVLKKHGAGLHREIIQKILAEYAGITPKIGSVADALARLKSKGLIVRVAPGAYMIVGGHR